ncbi:MAG: hypothetical protein ABW026_10045 [Microvirga sp.]
MSIRDHRPCGACDALVPADAGCKHWKPGTAATARSARRGRAAAREKEKAARDKARAAVERFLAVKTVRPGL